MSEVNESQAVLHDEPEMLVYDGPKKDYLTALDYIEIQNLIHRLLHTMDAGDAAGFASLFTEDGQLTVKLVNETCEGRADIRNWCVRTKKKFEQCMHWEGNVVIECGDVNMATNLSYWKAVSGDHMVSLGIHRDVVVKEKGVWRIKRRIIEHTWTRALGHVSQAVPY